MTRTVADAYTDTAGAWAAGPELVYGRLATVLCEHAPVSIAGRSVVDVGAGTGAAARAALGAGASSVVAIDASIGMLRHDARHRPPAAVADALALPFADASFDGAVAAFSINHLAQPGLGLREMARVSRSGAPLLAATYAADDTHPVKGAVEAALVARGWQPAPWYVELRCDITPRLATEEGCRTALDDAGLDGRVAAVRVPFPELATDDLIHWRLGMAQHAPFFATLDAGERQAVIDDARHALGDAPGVLVRSILVLTAVTD